jgi:probable F420-dependent oxidoreductase
MQIGVVFPQTEIGDDPVDVRLYVTGVEQLGFDFLVAYDHVLGANPNRPGGWDGPYTHRSMFHEVFVLLGWASGITTSLELATEVLVLPQRQTALVAKQAAEVDILSGGRFRLGVGIGWNAIEYDALGMSFSNRGRRVEEQIEVLRRLWAEDLLTYSGRWHHVDDAGINPRPADGRIPLWMGGYAEPALRRIARIADGWMLNRGVGEEVAARVEQMRTWVREAGRDVDAFGLETRVVWRGDIDAVAAEIDAWRALGATHVSVNTMGAGIQSAHGHLDVLRSVMGRWRGTS